METQWRERMGLEQLLGALHTLLLPTVQGQKHKSCEHYLHFLSGEITAQLLKRRYRMVSVFNLTPGPPWLPLQDLDTCRCSHGGGLCTMENRSLC